MTVTSIAKLACHSDSPADVVARFVDKQTGRLAAEDFIAGIFARHYGARLPCFMPELVTLARDGCINAAVGIRSARHPLFLERYLDEPVEAVIRQIVGHSVSRQTIAEVGQLAADRSSAGITLMLCLAHRLAADGYEWMVFTATEELRGILVRLGLLLFAIAHADPSRLGNEAQAWGRYYEHHPLIVCASVGNATHCLTRGNVARRMRVSA